MAHIRLASGALSLSLEEFKLTHYRYSGLDKKYAHEFVNHLEKYVDGRVHTNGLENFWSLLKRGLHGTYVAVEPFHLFRYVDEQAFRFKQSQHKGQSANRC